MEEQTIIYKGIEIKIERDDYAESPDVWENDDVFLVYDHRDFYVKREGFDPQDIFDFTRENPGALYEGYHVFDLYAYIHSGVSLSLGRGSCSFDTSMKGFVLVQRQKGWSWRREIAGGIAESLIKHTWNVYLSGEIYSYVSEYSSCSGFYGDEGIEDGIKEAKAKR